MSETTMTFSFSDVNPITGRTYAQSRFRELPGFVADLVTDVLGMRPGEWDVEVEDGTAYDWTGTDDRYPAANDTAPRLVAEDVTLVVVA